jgi:2',3'-cyclic-nucleotide 2'-phosphodiesterase (5'-nucleotidase family)
MVTHAEFNNILGETPNIGIIEYIAPFPDKPLIEEGAFAGYVGDVLVKELDADVAFINSGNIRGILTKGTVTARDISSVFPFKNKLAKVAISEQDLVDALNRGGSSLLTSDNKPNILQVGGMTYKLSKEGKVTEVVLGKKDGTKRQLDLDNLSKERNLVAVYDDFILCGGDGFKSLTKDDPIKLYNFDKDEVVINYFKRQTAPQIIKRDGRIKIEK